MPSTGVIAVEREILEAHIVILLPQSYASGLVRVNPKPSLPAQWSAS